MKSTVGYLNTMHLYRNNGDYLEQSKQLELGNVTVTTGPVHINFSSLARTQHIMKSSNENISALLALFWGDSPVSGEFLSPRPVTRSFDVSFDLCLNKRSRKQSIRRGFKTPSHSLWRHCKDTTSDMHQVSAMLCYDLVPCDCIHDPQN